MPGGGYYAGAVELYMKVFSRSSIPMLWRVEGSLWRVLSAFATNVPWTRLMSTVHCVIPKWHQQPHELLDCFRRFRCGLFEWV